MRNSWNPGWGRCARLGVRVGLRRAAAATPAMLGSLLLVLVTIGGLDPWAAGPILFSWLGCGAVALTRVGERVAVRAAFGFRRPSSVQSALLQPLWRHRCGWPELPPGRSSCTSSVPGPNAYATGGRSVAVTGWVLEIHRTGRLSPAQVVAVLVDELGHDATGATRPMVIAMWLAAPRRAAARLFVRLGSLHRAGESSGDRAVTARANRKTQVAAGVRSRRVSPA